MKQLNSAKSCITCSKWGDCKALGEIKELPYPKFQKGFTGAVFILAANYCDGYSEERGKMKRKLSDIGYDPMYSESNHKQCLFTFTGNPKIRVCQRCGNETMWVGGKNFRSANGGGCRYDINYFLCPFCNFEQEEW